MVVVRIVSVIVNGVSDDLVALALVSEQLLQTEDQADDESNLADDKGFECYQSQGTEGNRDKGGSLQFQEEKDRQQGFNNLLLFATSWNIIPKRKFSHFSRKAIIYWHILVFLI